MESMSTDDNVRALVFNPFQREGRATDSETGSGYRRNGPGDTARGEWQLLESDVGIEPTGALPDDDGYCDEACLRGTQPAVVGDFNGDGWPDLAVAGAFEVEGQASWNIHLRKPATFEGTPADGRGNLVRRVTDGYGATIDVTYRTMSDPTVYERTQDCAYPAACLRDARTLAWRVETNRDSDDAATETYMYRDARIDAWARADARVRPDRTNSHHQRRRFVVVVRAGILATTTTSPTRGAPRPESPPNPPSEAPSLLFKGTSMRAMHTRSD